MSAAQRQAVVLAGGLATRMLPLTERVPKILLPITGASGSATPFLHLLLERLETCGFDEVVLCLGHLAEAVTDELARRPPRLRVVCSHDGPSALGTLGALRQALPLLASELLVTYGDSYLPFDYAAPLAALRASPEAHGCMAVYRNADAIEPSNCAVSEGRVVRYDKACATGSPTLDCIDYGAIALRREILREAPSLASERASLEGLQAALAAQGTLLAYEARDRFFQIGSPEGLRELERHLQAESGTLAP